MTDLSLGAIALEGDRCRFCVWAPEAQTIEVHVTGPSEFIEPLSADAWGYHRGTIEGVKPGSLYFYRIDGQKERPDPASRCQPKGVHGPSEVVRRDYTWSDACRLGLPLQDYIIYEMHVGAFTPEGTFDAVVPYLDYLVDLGITAVEIMPAAQFPGDRNWGYDGVYPFAVQDSYGGHAGLKRLVDACHRKNLAVILDVVYNHLGPEGNYLWDFGPYFTDRYHTPWGSAVNFDGPYSDEVRRFFLENAIYWIREFHIDALRLDAVHAIMDFSAHPFLERLGDAVHEEGLRLNRRVHLFPESNLNDSRLIRSKDLGGFGLDAQWNDDFHHSLRTLLTHEKSGYYKDFGELAHMVKAYRDGFVYSGEYSAYRKRAHGNSSSDIPAHRFIVFAQNHDQIGNRMLGDRLSASLSLEELKFAAGCVLLSPFIPLLFMGEEYGETAPFPYFISHGDPDLIEAVRKGRREEFSEFKWAGETPDPQDERTFDSAKLDHSLRGKAPHGLLLNFYKELIRLRKNTKALAYLGKDRMEVAGFQKEEVIVLRRWYEDDDVVCVFHFGEETTGVTVPVPEGRWRTLLDSSLEKWGGVGGIVRPDCESDGELTLGVFPRAFIVLQKERKP